MNKKFISAVLAGACALSMTSIATFAADTAISELGSDGVATQQVTVTSTTAMPSLKVTVPTTADVVLNPYKINVTTPITGNDTLFSPEYEIKNESQCGITVSATVKATPGGAAAIATAALKGTETTKSVFMYLETTTTSGSYYEGGYVAKKVTAKSGQTLTDEQVAANAACDAQMIVTAKDTTKDIATLAAGDSTAQSVWLKIQGDAVTAPKIPWVAADKVDLALTLKITPNANAETGAGGPVVSSYEGLTALSVTKTGGGEMISSFDAATKTYTVSGAAAFDAYTIAPTAAAGSTATMACAAATGGAAGTFTPATGALSVGNTLPLAVVITVTDGTDTDTYTINFTA